MSDATRSDPAFRTFLAARFLALLADQMALLAIPVAVYVMTGEVAWSGLALAVQWLPRILLLPILGRLVDIYPLRSQYLLIDTTRTVLALLLVVAPNLALILVVAGALSLLNGHAFVILEYTVGTRFDQSSLPRKQSQLQVIENLSRVLGPGLAGLGLSAFGLSATLGACAALFALAFMLCATMFPQEARSATTGRPSDWLEGIAAGASTLWKVRPLRRLTGLTMGVNFLDGVLTALMPALVITRLGQSEAVIGYLNSVGALAVMAAMALFSRLATERAVAFLGHAALVLSLVAVAVIAADPPLAAFAAAYVSYVLARSAFVLYLRAERVRHIPSERLGQILGVLIAVILATIPLSGLVVSLLSEAWPVGAILSAGILVTGAFHCISLLTTRPER